MRARLALLLFSFIGFSGAVASASPSESKVSAIRTLVARTSARPEIGSQRDADLAFVRSGEGFKDSAGGEWLGKSGKGDAQELDRLGNEHATAAIYRIAEGAFGTMTPEVRSLRIEGKPYLLARKIPLDDARTFSDDQLQQFGRGFVIDAWLANWDVGGAWQLTADASGRPVRIVASGGGLFRPSGEPKGAAFNDRVSELGSMRDPLKPTSFGFRRLTGKDVKDQLQKFAAWYPVHHAEIDAAIDGTSLGSAAALTLKTKLAARAAWMIKQARK